MHNYSEVLKSVSKKLLDELANNKRSLTTYLKLLHDGKDIPPLTQIVAQLNEFKVQIADIKQKHESLLKDKISLKTAFIQVCDRYNQNQNIYKQIVAKIKRNNKLQTITKQQMYINNLSADLAPENSLEVSIFGSQTILDKAHSLIGRLAEEKERILTFKSKMQILDSLIKNANVIMKDMTSTVKKDRVFSSVVLTVFVTLLVFLIYCN